MGPNCNVDTELHCNKKGSGGQLVSQFVQFLGDLVHTMLHSVLRHVQKLPVSKRELNLGRDFAKRIMTAHFETPGEADVWKTGFIHTKLDGHWIKINTDHIQINGGDAVHIVIENKAKILSAISNGTFDKPLHLVKDVCWVETLHIPDRDVNYVGKKDAKAKEILKDFHAQFKTDFYIPVDMSHCFDGEPIILNYTFKKDLSFEECWDGVRKLKKNENNFLFDERNLWRNYLAVTPGWVTIVHPPKSINEHFFVGGYDYDRVNLQGLGIFFNKEISLWSFSFFAQPDMKDFFIKKYKLTPYKV